MINNKAKGASTPANKLLQFRLLEQALLEQSIDINKFDVTVNHRMGTIVLNNHTIGLKYPKSYLEKIKNLSSEKIYDFCFVGHFESFGREQMLEPFIDKNSYIKHSIVGRTDKKFDFDDEYYQILSNTKFSLVPNHIGKKAKKWQHPDAWSYRFIETMFSRSVPVLFKKSPLGENVVKDFKFLWDDDNFNISDREYQDTVNHNFNVAVEKFTINIDDIRKLRI
jgi:hypothetical protein